MNLKSILVIEKISYMTWNASLMDAVTKLKKEYLRISVSFLNIKRS